jgi:hypothetical protein
VEKGTSSSVKSEVTSRFLSPPPPRSPAQIPTRQRHLYFLFRSTRRVLLLYYLYRVVISCKLRIASSILCAYACADSSLDNPARVDGPLRAPRGRLQSLSSNSPHGLLFPHGLDDHRDIPTAVVKSLPSAYVVVAALSPSHSLLRLEPEQPRYGHRPSVAGFVSASSIVSALQPERPDVVQHEPGLAGQRPDDAAGRLQAVRRPECAKHERSRAANILSLLQSPHLRMTY